MFLWMFAMSPLWYQLFRFQLSRGQNNRFSNAQQNVQYYQIFTGHFKNPSDMFVWHHGSRVCENSNQIMYGSWDMVHNRQMDGQMHGKSDIKKWVPHLKTSTSLNAFKHNIKKHYFNELKKMRLNSIFCMYVSKEVYSFEFSNLHVLL